MQRIALSTTVLVAALWGCQEANQSPLPTQSASVDYGLMDNNYYEPVAEDRVADSEPVRDYGLASSVSYEPATTTTETHVIAKGDTLFRLARSYYSDASRWRDIYEANRDVLSDPNRLHVGDELVIP
jgi:nucleoid-associated protein YgaU